MPASSIVRGEVSAASFPYSSVHGNATTWTASNTASTVSAASPMSVP